MTGETPWDLLLTRRVHRWRLAIEVSVISDVFNCSNKLDCENERDAYRTLDSQEEHHENKRC